MLRPWLTRLALAVVLSIHLAHPAAADAIAGLAASESPPANERLDTLLAARDWNALAAALSQAKTGDQFAQNMEWMRAKLLAGGGSLLGFLYSRDLWTAGQQAKAHDPMKDLRVTAGLFTLYTFALIAIDGAKCADASAPSHRVDQLIENNRPILQFLKAQPAELKAKIVDLTLAIERDTAPLRKDDDVLCRDGLDQMQAGLAAGNVKQVTPADGLGKTYEVAPPPDYQPKFLAPSEYEPAQRKARETLRSNLRTLID